MNAQYVLLKIDYKICIEQDLLVHIKGKSTLELQQWKNVKGLNLKEQLVCLNLKEQLGMFKLKGTTRMFKLKGTTRMFKLKGTTLYGWNIDFRCE